MTYMRITGISKAKEFVRSFGVRNGERQSRKVAEVKLLLNHQSKMYAQRGLVDKLIRIRNIKLILIFQSIITTTAIIYMMILASTVDQASKLEMEHSDEERCGGCCVMRQENLEAITREPQLSEKLHKFSRAIRNYEIPDYIMKTLHDGERKILEFEIELKRLKQNNHADRMSKLHGVFIEDDTTPDEDLVPASKPKWTKPPMTSRPSNFSKPRSSNSSHSHSNHTSESHSSISTKSPPSIVPQM